MNHSHSMEENKASMSSDAEHKAEPVLMVSIIIVNWNTKGLLCQCIQSIHEEAGSVSCEIIVIDNASTDGSPEEVRKRFPQVKLIANKRNRGFASAVNQGLWLARGKYILFLHSDIIVCEGAVSKTASYMEQHSDVGIMTCQIRSEANVIQMTCSRFPLAINLGLRAVGFRRVFKSNSFLDREQMKEWNRDSEHEVDAISSMYILVRREAVDRIGGMDEQYFMYFETIDWCHRFHKAGWKCVFWPGAFAKHALGEGGSIRMQSVPMCVRYDRSMYLYFQKHYSFIHYVAARIINIIRYSLQYLIQTVILEKKKICSKNYRIVQKKKTKIVELFYLFAF